MAADVAKDLLQQFAGTVGDFGLVLKNIIRLHKDADADDAAKTGKSPDNSSPTIASALSAIGRRLFARLDGGGAGDASGGQQFAVANGKLPAYEKEIAGSRGGTYAAIGRAAAGRVRSSSASFLWMSISSSYSIHF